MISKMLNLVNIADKSYYVNSLRVTHDQRKEKEQENWRPLPEYGVDVSDLGNIRITGTNREPAISLARGYKQIGRWSGAITVHRLVMLAFVGPCPEGNEVDHINGIRDDNRLVNLRYVTRSQNINGSVERGHRGSNRWNAVLTEEIVRQIKEMHRNGKKPKAITEATGVSKANVDHVLYGHNWKHVK